MRLKMQPVGMASWFLSSRDLLIERLWREEADGTIVLLFRSHIDQGDASELNGKEDWYTWFNKPVKAKVVVVV